MLLPLDTICAEVDNLVMKTFRPRPHDMLQQLHTAGNQLLTITTLPYSFFLNIPGLYFPSADAPGAGGGGLEFSASADDGAGRSLRRCGGL
jgi:hypothetical protein